MQEWTPILVFKFLLTPPALGVMEPSFCGPWSASQQPVSIAYKELFPIVVAASSYTVGSSMVL